MNYTSTRYLGSTTTAGSAASGSRYVSHTERRSHTTCWMELAVFDSFPRVPSLAGTYTQAAVSGAASLSVSTKAAGRPASGGPIRLAFELFDDESPTACTNFRRLCAGANGGSASTDAPWQQRSASFVYKDVTPCYKGTSLHKIIPGFCVQGGDLTMRLLPTTTGSPTYRSSNQFAGNPTRRGAFPDENKKRRHNEAGLLSMANTGPNSNGTQFFITTSGDHEQALNGRHVCFGRVTSGLAELLAQVAPHGDVRGRPTKYVVVVDCGEGPLPPDGGITELTLSSEADVVAESPSLAPIAECEQQQQHQQQQQQQQQQLSPSFEETASADAVPSATNSPACSPTADLDVDVDVVHEVEQPEMTTATTTADILVVEEPEREVDGAAAAREDAVLENEKRCRVVITAADRESPFAVDAPAADTVKAAAAADEEPFTQERKNPIAPPQPQLKSSFKTGQPAMKKKRVTIQM